MAAAGDIYERELKYLLEGDSKTLTKMSKTCNQAERDAYNQMTEAPFLVIRAAGSLGVDLVALRWDFSFPIEVKSSVGDTLHFSKNERLNDQAERMMDTCARSHVLPIYAYRLKGYRGDPWRIFTIPSEPLRGRAGLLQEKIPKLEMTKGGSFVMRWNDGMKLSDLLSYTGLSSYRE
ncbi:MAG: Holliday junction resolvase [Candidatus Methanomethylophilus sp.]|nr:Holliday junction resolvase [Methanomethylophilus sp.]